MHTCLTLTNVGGHWYVEREVSGLIAALGAYCDSIHSCDISVEGPSGEGEARCWRVDLKMRIFDEIVRAVTRAPEGTDPHSPCPRVLDDIYARATTQLMTNIAEQHAWLLRPRRDRTLQHASRRAPDRTSVMSDSLQFDAATAAPLRPARPALHLVSDRAAVRRRASARRSCASASGAATATRSRAGCRCTCTCRSASARASTAAATASSPATCRARDTYLARL